MFEAITIFRITNSGINIWDFDTFAVFTSKTWKTVASAAAFTPRHVYAASLVVSHLTILGSPTLS